MKITNNFDLPETFLNVINRPTYSSQGSQITVTQILNSPRIVNLTRKHWNDLEEDASDYVWSLFGSAVHNILEHGRDDHHVVEQRLHIDFDGWSISGAIDLQEVYEDGVVISDYKVTGSWAVMNEKSDWHKQLNMYAWLVENVKGQTVKGLQIVAIIRDWSRRDAQVKEHYPKSPVTVINIPLWSQEEREAYVKSRLKLHNDAYFSANSDDKLPECTADEMWEKPTTYAVKKDGGIRAKSVHSTREEAELSMPAKGYIIEVREGDRTRCSGFCSVSKFCDQYQNYLKGKS
jgi:hypothetical protein